MKLEYFEKDAADNIVLGLEERFQRKFTTIIGIDPDAKASGFAVYRKDDRALWVCKCLPFFDLYKELEHARNYFAYPKGIIEGGWLIGKTNWHDKEYWNDLNSTISAANAVIKQPGHYRTRDVMAKLTNLVSSKTIATRESIARRVGENHQTGKLIVEMFIHVGIPFQVVPPRKPIFEQEQYFKKITGWKERTNKDARSAANYCFGY